VVLGHRDFKLYRVDLFAQSAGTSVQYLNWGNLYDNSCSYVRA